MTDDGCSQKQALLSSGVVTVPESRYPLVPGFESFGLSEFLALPASFGSAKIRTARAPSAFFSAHVLSFSSDIYVGETFVCYVSASNDGEFPVSNLIFKAEIQTSKGRYQLYDNSKDPILELTPGRSFDHIVRHHLSEVGGHVYAFAGCFSLPGLTSFS